jgi:hypothetical protein
VASAWLKDAVKYSLDLGAILGGAAALLIVLAAAREGYRRTLGRRRDRYERLGRLGTGAQLSFFVAVLGEPPAMRKTITKADYVDVVSEGDPHFDPALAGPEDAAHEVRAPQEFTECFFIDRDFYVQTISDHDETILAFSVTRRRPRFRPVLEMPAKLGWLDRWRWRQRAGEKFEPLFRVRLGRTRFADLDNGPDAFAGPHFNVGVGARSYSYSEFHYFGNPGHYQTFVFTASSAAGSAPIGEPLKIREEVGGDEWPDPEREYDERSWEDLPLTQRFRRETAITTYTVIGPELWERNYPSSFGPHGDEVRTLP